MYTILVYFVQFIIKRRNCVLMVTAEMPSETTAAGGTVNYVLSGAIVVVGILIAYLGAVISEIYQVKVCRCDMEILITKIAGNGQRLQEHLRANYRRTEI